jgi:regulator of protease activity HflC (stomatin/prohibitin superfamily)
LRALPLRVLELEPYERGLVFVDGVCTRLLAPGRHLLFDPWLRQRVDVLSVRPAQLLHPDLELIVKAGVLRNEALVLDLADHERALVWIDGRLAGTVGAGLSAYWTGFHSVRAEVCDARELRCAHPEAARAAAMPACRAHLEAMTVASGFAGVLFRDGKAIEVLAPGVHVFWKGEAHLRVMPVDLREQALDLAGQEILSADTVPLRINATVTYRVVDPLVAVTAVEAVSQALYRQAQLALRAVVGTRTLDALLAEKDGVARELLAQVREQSMAMGVEVVAVGMRDLILPGEIREILNRVTTARKVAEAALVTRREETAAMRSQANTARIFESNPTLMRLRELEVLEKVTERANLSVVLGDGGLAERVVKLL